jgi:exosortase
VLLVLGVLGAELLLTRVSLLMFLAGTIVFLWGWRLLRMLAFPFVLLALTIPIPGVLLTQVTLPLQLFASRVAEVLLGVVRVPVVRDGNVLVLTNATLSVAEACSGVRSLTALVALALILARFTDRRPGVRAAIVLSAPIVAILLNSLRVTATAIATYAYGPAFAEGLLHDVAGSLVFVLACLLMLAAARAIQTMAPVRSMEPGR